MHALIGRGDELRRIAMLAGAATVGAPTVLLIEGPPGSGRTRLLEETARLARRRGVTVLAEPEWAGAAGSRRLLDTAGDGPLLFAADHPGRVDPRAWPVLELLAEKRAVLVVLAGGGVPYLPTAVVHRIRLGPLTAAAQAEFVAHLTGARPDPQLTDLCRVAAGRPAALRELLTGLGEDGLLRVDAGRATIRVTRLPRRAEEHLRGLVASVSVPARHLLQAAATIGVSFPLARLARLMGVGPITLLPAIEEAIESGLLAGDGERLAFGHELVRAVVESTLPRPVAAALRGEPPRRPSRPVPPPRPGLAPGRVDWAALSPREQEIADLVGQALTNRQIARRTAISPHTVNFHLRQIFQKLGLVSRVELVALWHQRMASAGSREAPPSSS
ncbi:LuxR C-terminal-related transcriptional regulator [Actinoplanes sp. NPDC026670]|uniref:LuxR C-terminal-related transcriptional regulator n=1 Tax=Actinoplanes sp. NPDC026670 TaxID=3154700 RepID=UPI0033C1C886